VSSNVKKLVNCHQRTACSARKRGSPKAPGVSFTSGVRSGGASLDASGRKLDHLCQRHRVSAVAGGTVQSFKTNEIFGNGSDGTPLAAVPNGLQ
jgi:hypothetical protein